MFFAGCGGAGNSSQSATTPTPCKEAAIEKETAILIAKGDAIENYTLSAYNIIAEEQPGGWRIVFELKDPGVKGGGPDYLIDKKTGKILHATYNK
jgi:hypothetical protein